MNKLSDKLLLFLVFLLAIAFSIKNLREPDLWWQIRTGEWIIQNHRMPLQDVFSYTYSGVEWINVKWLSEVLYAIITSLSGPECVFLVQSVVICLLVLFLIKLRDIIGKSGSSVSTALALAFTLIAVEYRINGRPEMFSHLFSVVFLFFLIRHHKGSSNRIYWLIPLQILWTNLHEAFGIGVVLCGIFLVGEWLEYMLFQRKVTAIRKQMPKRLSLLFVPLVFSLMINPNGYKLLTRPLNILGQIYENKYTTELFDFRKPEYWQWNVYLTLVLLVIGIGGVAWFFFSTKPKKNKSLLLVEEMGVGYLLTLLAFFYLASTAYRNVIFFALVFFPVFHWGVAFLLSKIPALTRYKQRTQWMLIVCLLVFYGLVVSNKYYDLTKSRDRFGLEVVSAVNPTGAAEFIERKHLQGKAFSDYLTSSYFVWKLQPEFKTFIDLRDLDIFPSAFFNTFAEAVTFPEAFQQLDSVYRFKYVVLFRPQFNSLHTYLFNDSRFELAYIDAVACVYIPKKPNADTSSIHFSDVQPIAASSLASVINHLFNPLYKPYNYHQFDSHLLAAAYALNVGQTEEAEAFARKSIDSKIETYKGFEILGEVYYEKALQASDANSKNQLLGLAADCYRQSIHQQSDFAPSFLGLGAVSFQQQNYLQALENFETAIALDKTNLSAYNFAAECCKYFVNLNNSESVAYLKKAIELYRKADSLNPDNPTITLNMGFLYYRNGDCNNASKYLNKVQDFPGLTEEQRKNAKECLRKCGV